MQLFIDMLILMLVCRKPWLDSWCGDSLVISHRSRMCDCLFFMASPSPTAQVIHAYTDTNSDFMFFAVISLAQW